MEKLRMPTFFPAQEDAEKLPSRESFQNRQIARGAEILRSPATNAEIARISIPEDLWIL